MYVWAVYHAHGVTELCYHVTFFQTWSLAINGAAHSYLNKSQSCGHDKPGLPLVLVRLTRT